MKTLFSLLLVFLSFTVLAQNTYIGHRGASYLAPENTLASLKLGWELGADACELDVYLSKDNRIMVIHDSDTERTSGETSNLVIAETNSDELRKVDVGSFKAEKYAGEKIPFLEEVIEAIPDGQKLVVEIKCGAEIVPYLVDLVKETGKLNQLIFISFDWDAIVASQKAFPDNKCYYLKMFPFGLSSKIKQAAKEGLAGINLYYKIINKRVVKKAQKQNLEVLVWTVDSPEVAQKLADMGVTTFTTNRPAWLKQQLEGE